jgi:predicted nuclease with TOPRIM domain
MKDMRERIQNLRDNESVVVEGLEPLHSHLDQLQEIFEELEQAFREQPGCKLAFCMPYLWLAAQAELSAARILAETAFTTDSPPLRTALAAIRRCSKVIRELAYRRLECLSEVVALYQGDSESAELALELLAEIETGQAL